jgi:hypothetical protein
MRRADVTDMTSTLLTTKIPDGIVSSVVSHRFDPGSEGKSAARAKLADRAKNLHQGILN